MKTTRRRFVRAFLGAVLFSIFSVPALHSLEREGNMTLYLLLDRSVSMSEEFENVKEFVGNEIIEKMLISGDTLVVIEFFRMPKVIISRKINGKEDKRDVAAIVNGIDADKAFTDIGRALDRLTEGPDKWDFKNTRTHTILLSDLVHEAPPESPYAGKTEEFSHPVLDLRKETQRDGWRICIIGPGVEERAGALAHEIVTERGNK